MIKKSQQENKITNKEKDFYAHEGNTGVCTQFLTSMCFRVNSEKELLDNLEDAIPSEGSPLIVMGNSWNESKLLNDKGNVKPVDMLKFNLTNKGPLRQMMWPTTQDYSAIGGAENEKLYTWPNIKNSKPVMKGHNRRVFPNKFARLRGLFKSEVVKKPLFILNKMDSARILKEIGQVDE